MADKTKEPMDAGELSADDLQQVAGGSTPINPTEIKVINKLPTPAQPNPGKTSVGWDIATNSEV
jgi:hypothetical protein